MNTNQAQELRIGNYLYWDSHEEGTGLMAGKIDGEDIKRISENEKYAADHSPIPLSPEILEKAGFKNNGLNFSHSDWFEKGLLRIGVDARENFKWRNGVFAVTHKQMSPPSSVITDIQYVHQLQNLYYYLRNGEELTISL